MQKLLVSASLANNDKTKMYNVIAAREEKFDWGCKLLVNDNDNVTLCFPSKYCSFNSCIIANRSNTLD